MLAIVGPPTVRIDAIADAARAAEDGGVTAVQLRVKDVPAHLLYHLADRLIAELTVPLYVNDRADVAVAAGASGVHVGAADIPARLLRAVAPRPFRIGVSVGTAAEADDALKSDVDYWSVGPVYATATKPGAGPPIGLAGFHALRERAPRGLSVIGIGGIDAANAAAVIHAGAAGVAVSRGLFDAANVRVAAEELRAVVDAALRA